MSLTSGTRLGPYEILTPLGAGGMGEVYRAKDPRLSREVAIKVLPPSVAGEPESLARFEREAKAVAAISHPNILAIHDFGTDGGVAYAVMELLEGETLREKLASGALPEKQAVDFAAQIARGLSAAHEKGIIHRDLKPENVFVSRDGHVKILDFGLAKHSAPVRREDETSAPTQEQQTTPGTVLGTIGYMSPEQVRGLELDHRSDVFSFGAVLYEMLAGRRAFRGQTAADTMSAILKEEPAALSASGSRVSPSLDRVVRRCLEKEPSNRFQSARDIAFALSESSPPAPLGTSRFPRPSVLVLLAAVVLGAAGILLLRKPPRATAAPQAGSVRRIAVLPFENLGAAEDDYFADGVADAVRGKLTTLPGIEVIARASCVGYRKTTKTPREIAAELGAGYLMTGTIRWQKSGGASRIQVSPELVEVKSSGAPASKWQQPFDASLTDVFQVQSDIAARVAQALGIVLGGAEEKRLSEKPTQNLAAYDAFLKGKDVCKTSSCYDPVNARRSLGFFEQAVALDPAFALAWARVSQGNSNLYYVSTPSPEIAQRAREAAEKAIALAPDAPEGYLALGSFYDGVANDLAQAQKAYARGLALGPENVELLVVKGTLERDLGRFEEALELARRAERLDPRSLQPKVMLGLLNVYLRRYGEARRAIDSGLALQPGDLALIGLKAETWLGEGDLAGARKVLDDAPREVESTALVAFLATGGDLSWMLDEPRRDILLRLTPAAFDGDRAVWGICLAQGAAQRGDSALARRYAEEARKGFEDQIRVSPQSPALHSNLGLALAYLGEKQAAIAEGERGVALRPVARDAFSAPYYSHLLARIYVLTGEPEKALGIVEQLLRSPYDLLSPGILRIDPNWDPLRSNLRFQRLAAEKS